eukprot:2945284-Amphidinium_carterae.1
MHPPYLFGLDFNPRPAQHVCIAKRPEKRTNPTKPAAKHSKPTGIWEALFSPSGGDDDPHRDPSRNPHRTPPRPSRGGTPNGNPRLRDLEEKEEEEEILEEMAVTMQMADDGYPPVRKGDEWNGYVRECRTSRENMKLPRLEIPEHFTRIPPPATMQQTRMNWFRDVNKQIFAWHQEAMV